jgi:putative transposase
VAGDGRRTWQGAAGRPAHGPESYGSSKKGAKRSLLSEGQGVPLGITPAGANVNDHKLIRATIESIPIERPKASKKRPQHLCLDRGYDYAEARELADEFGFTAHIRSRGDEHFAREAGMRARRWVVERTHSRLHRFRRILTRWEKRADTYLAMLHLACALITWRAVNWGR